jgi:predicted dehydrogenase
MSTVTPYPLAIIGCRFGKYVAQDLSVLPDAAFRLFAVCDLKAELAQPLARELGVPAEQDYRKLLNDPQIKAIGLFTGPVGRAKLMREILQSGKDIMTTKPFEADPGAAREILEEASRLRRVIHLNSPAAKLSKDLLTIRRWEGEHNLGRPIYFTAVTHADYFESADGSWYDDTLRCPAAPLFRIGIYVINDVLTLFGQVAAARLVQTRVRTGRPTSDNAAMTLEMENGAVGTIIASFCVRDGDPYRNTLQIGYERGTIYRDVGPSLEGRKAMRSLQLVKEVKERSKIIETEHFETDQNHYDWNTFAEDIRARRPADTEYIARIVNGVDMLRKLSVAQLDEQISTTSVPDESMAMG